jgi:hypothetical protein
VLIDAELNVVCSHGRTLASKELGWTEVPTIRLEHLSGPQAEAFMIADNRLTEISLWDERLLGEQLKELSLLDLDFSLEATGFEMGEIDLRIEALTSDKPADDDSADQLPVVAAGPVVTKPGDIWKLGVHRVHCGSALDAATYTALMQDLMAAMIITDPPYNERISNISGLGAIHHREFLMASGKMNESQFTEFLTRTFSHLARNSVPGSLHFIFMDCDTCSR